MSLLKHQPLREELTTEGQIRRRTIKAFLGFGLAGLVPFGFWKWLGREPKDAGLKRPFRRMLNASETASRKVFFSRHHLAPTFPKEMAAAKPRVNGKEGLRSALPTDFVIRVEQPGKAPLQLTIDDIKALPRQEITFQFKCIEGWSQIQNWAGVRFADFVQHYGLGTRNGQKASPEDTDQWFNYVGMETPDKGYYVGVDMPSALHPQTLLAYETNGEPIDDVHGAPLRLIVPVKYGVKNLKRIGLIRFADNRPRDYWAERGYDYYVGL